MSVKETHVASLAKMMTFTDIAEVIDRTGGVISIGMDLLIRGHVKRSIGTRMVAGTTGIGRPD